MLCYVLFVRNGVILNVQVNQNCFFQSNADWTCDKCLWEIL